MDGRGGALDELVAERYFLPLSSHSLEAFLDKNFKPAVVLKHFADQMTCTIQTIYVPRNTAGRVNGEAQFAH